MPDAIDVSYDTPIPNNIGLSSDRRVLRAPHSLPCVGPLKEVPDSLLRKRLVFSRVPGQPKHYVQDQLREALGSIAEGIGLPWRAVRDAMRDVGRYHVETG